MKLTKTFCDICKEEVPDYLHQWVELSGHVDMCSGACNSVKLEVCRQCGVEFFLLLEKMKDSAANTLGMGDTTHNKPSDEICPFCRGSGEIHTMQDRETIVTKCFCKLPDKLRTSVNRCGQVFEL